MTRTHVAPVVVAAAVLGMISGCGGGAGQPAPATRTLATQTPQAPAATKSTHHWTMPDLRGKGLQSAQDAMQALTGDPLFLTSSHDVTGRGRHQILDRDWQVCTQNVAPGGTITMQSVIDFGVVRINTEHCP